MLPPLVVILLHKLLPSAPASLPTASNSCFIDRRVFTVCAPSSIHLWPWSSTFKVPETEMIDTAAIILLPKSPALKDWDSSCSRELSHSLQLISKESCSRGTWQCPHGSGALTGIVELGLCKHKQARSRWQQNAPRIKASMNKTRAEQCLAKAGHGPGDQR